MLSYGSELPVGLPGLITASARGVTPFAFASATCASSTEMGIVQPSASSSS